jgi:benzoylformate decarboxylase
MTIDLVTIDASPAGSVSAPTSRMSVADLLVRTLACNGVTSVFGNPGTTEIPLVRACEGLANPKYVVALSEIAAVPMTDGFARTTRSLGVVNLHVAPGLGNGMGGLYTAGIAHTPLLVIIGSQDRRFLYTNPVLWGPIEGMAATVMKAVVTLNGLHDAAFNIYRAIRTALTPPYGPVALICPPDLLEEELEAAPGLVHAPALASLSAVHAERYARLLADARAPAFIVAEDAYWDGASEAVEQLAGLLGAPIHVAPYTAVLPISSRSAFYAGYLPPGRKKIADQLAERDLLFFIGGTGMRTTLYSEGDLPQTKLWVGNDPTVLASGGEFVLATIANIRGALAEIVRVMRPHSSGGPAIAGSPRPQFSPPPYEVGLFHPSRAVKALLERFSDAVWFDESGLSTTDVRQWMQLPAGDYLINGSGGIGWALAAAVGAALGNPERQIVAIVGDGSVLYASEALWTAAHHGTRMLLVILSNRRYATLNEASKLLNGGPLNSFTIEPPILDFGGLATLHSWHYTRVASEDELRVFLASTPDRIKTNTLLELKLDPAVKPVTANSHF